ncbi:hypothetical protein EY643_11025 [Halioglobus maricola]|uniref:PasA protein n=1 Tax=Halioglobus maricola TaxID=2601894 RepID=A0A5P9NJY2_9GAMM|nr:DUF6586 family protein [Halioglobus maricola]QFU76151.1 hypothetical protein EY643_11025 [Halioglobus maricola]
MSSARGRANQSLYLARILLQAWRGDLAAETVAGKTLASAYLPATRAHLANAYGWFLLEIARPGALPSSPPQSLAELPEIAEGKAIAGELREFQHLEQDGWIGEMLAADTMPVQALSPNNLAVSAVESGPEQVETWANLLQQLFDRMGDSLDEY